MSEYHYTECGLDNIILVGVDVCEDHGGNETYTIPNINGLHRVIAQGIVSHKHAMSGKELRFLRTEMGMTQDQLAKVIDMSLQTIGRWERGTEPLSSLAEIVIRRLAVEKLNLEDGEGLRVSELSSKVAASSVTQQIQVRANNRSYELLAA